MCFDSQRPSGVIVGESDETKASVSSTMVNWNLTAKRLQQKEKKFESNKKHLTYLTKSFKMTQMFKDPNLSAKWSSGT